MKRKVILMGGKTYVISLPSTWIRKYSVSKSEELDVEENGNKIIITKASGAKKGGKIELDITNLEPILPRLIAALYKNGYSEIVFKSNNRNLITKAENYFNTYFIGIEVVQRTPTICHAKEISETMNQEFDSLFRRIFFSLLSAKNVLETALKDNDKSAFDEVLALEVANNNLVTLCRRMLNENGYSNPKKLVYLYSILEFFERISDEYKHISKHLMKNKKKLPVSEIKVACEIFGLVEKYHEFFYKMDMKDYVDYYLALKSMKERLLCLLDGNAKVDKRVVHHLASIVSDLVELYSYRLSLEFA